MQDNTLKLILLLINIVGGFLVLGSYVYGLNDHSPEKNELLWGGIPGEIRNLYVFSMILSALGYFFFTSFVFFQVPGEVKIGGRFGFDLFNILYLLILLPSALWMPLTFKMIEAPSAEIWFAIRTVLMMVGLASVGLLWAILSLGSQESLLWYRLAVAGIVVFAFHTLVLDALVWPLFFNPV